MSRLLTTGILQQARNGSGVWAPSDLTNLLAWYDASDTTTITESGGLVSQWDDKSGNSHHLTQVNASIQPSTGVETLNGLNVVSFVNKVMETSLPDTTECTVYMVFKDTNNINSVSLMIGADFTFTFRLLQFFVNSSIWESSFDDGVAVGKAQIAKSGDIALLSSYSSHIEDEIGLALDGSAFNTAARTNTLITANSLLLGSLFRNGSQFSINGYVAELIITSDVTSAADNTKAYNYLQTKWSV